MATASSSSASTSRGRKGQDEDLSNVEFETSEEVEVISSFDKMNLREDLLRGIYAYGESKGFVLIEVTCLVTSWKTDSCLSSD